ncbi:MAG: sulfotransferase [Rhizomicrobium sp.]
MRKKRRVSKSSMRDEDYRASGECLMDFIIVAMPRTGSNFLVAQLNAQPDIWCHGEVFADHHVWAKYSKNQKASRMGREPELLNLRESHLKDFLEALSRENGGRAHVGAKILFSHIHFDAIASDKAIKKIVLLRQNVLAQFASRSVSLATGAWNPQQMEKATREPVKFDATEFVKHYNRYVKSYRSLFASLNRSGQRYWVIRHDELNNDSAIEGVLSFLGAGASIVTAKHPDVRAPLDVVSRFSNQNDVLEFLRQNDKMAWVCEADVTFDRMKIPALADGNRQR